MSLANPGKSGILTVLALIIVIGVPGIIAYADSSSDTYDSSLDLLPAYKLGITDSDSEYYPFGVTTIENDDSISVVVDSSSIGGSTQLSSIDAVNLYSIMLGDVDFTPSASKITFATDLGAAAVSFMLLDSDSQTVASYSLQYNSETEVWEYEVTSVEAVSSEDAAFAKIVLTMTEAEAAVSDFEYSLSIVVPKTVFTEEIVELLVLVGGIMLLIIGTFALSFIDVGTPGKMFKSAGRGIRSAGRKINGRSR